MTIKKYGTNDIDFVLLWVDGSDKDWHLEKSKYVPGYNADASVLRYRDWDNLEYWFRGLEKYAPWVRKIHLITCGHCPKWLNLNHPKLNFVKHSDFIPSDCLPTFNSNTIVLNLHKIESLAEKFVLFNDDMFIINKIKESHFFKNDLPCDQAILHNIAPTVQFSYIDFNNMYIINKYFKKRTVIKNNLLKWFNIVYGKEGFNNILLLPWKNFSGIVSPHLPYPYLKKTFEEVWKAEKELLNKESKSKFRSKEGVNDWLFRYWRLMKGEFFPSLKIGKKFSISSNERSNVLIYNAIKKQKYKIVCINDEEENIDFELEKQKLKNAFEHIFPKKSSYEL
jgi:hypothetical protein